MGPAQKEAALRSLHDRHAPELWRFALRLTHDPQVAEDVVQEALLRPGGTPALEIAATRQPGPGCSP